MAAATNKITFCLVTLCAAASAYQRDIHPIYATTTQGVVTGVVVDGLDESSFFAFRGIPYAAPPVKHLRFKSPVPHPPWTTPLKSEEKPKCMQYNYLIYEVEGSEDCLYLNVYVPIDDNRHPEANLSVMVFFHGGAFQWGSSSELQNGPDFFMKHANVVLVTLNYRLGPFGFLNLDDDIAPGNMGLKDQRAALMWVQMNIIRFGGDPTRVTIFGNDAGAVSVHYHTLMPASHGLYHRAIMQGGNALSSYAYNEWNFELARQLAYGLGHDTDDLLHIFLAINESSANEILSATVRIVHNNPAMKHGFVMFGPGPERRPIFTEPKFITADPESMMRQPQVALVPTIAGYSGHPGHYVHAFGRLDDQPATLKEMLTSVVGLKRLLPLDLHPYNDDEQTESHVTRKEAIELTRLLKEEYRLAENEKDNLLDLLADLSVRIPLHRFVNLRRAALSITPSHARKALHLYHFNEDGMFNWGKKLLSIRAPGATHSDEMGYLMRIRVPDLQQRFGMQDPSSYMLRTLTHLWTKFANGGDLQDDDWPMATENSSHSDYLSLNSLGWTIGKGLGGPKAEFWDKIYGQWRIKPDSRFRSIP